MKKIKKIYKKWWLWAIIGFVFLIFLAAGTDSSANEQQSKDSNSNNQIKKEKTEQNGYMEALRKCSVMEAADIYTTGIGHKSDNVFNDGRATCESFYNQFGEKDFIETVNLDWENRKNETIEGKPLSHYLDILGW